MIDSTDQQHPAEWSLVAEQKYDTRAETTRSQVKF
jgi:hypothetical protein